MGVSAYFIPAIMKLEEGRSEQPDSEILGQKKSPLLAGKLAEAE
jgi:hypothetical protein